MHASLDVTAKNSTSVHASTAPYLRPHQVLLPHMRLLVFVSFKYTPISVVLSGALSNANIPGYHNVACSRAHWSLLVSQ